MSMLASDREREATILRLRAAHLEGRIDTDELEQRVERAQQARTREELDAVAVDVPERADGVVETTHGVPRLPGRRHFTERKLLDSPPAQVREAALMHIAPPLERHNFYLHRETPGELVWENRQSVGARVTMRLRDAGDGRTLVLVHGKAPLMVRRAFARLAAD
jgi:hypothetical protein